MACTIHVNGKSDSLVHKGSGGFAKNTLPDVCKTPSPGGPVPIPYPIIISLSSDLVKGTKTVKVDGGNMAAIKGSQFSRCTGDEPGTAGGVKSSTNMKEATWITSSPDVKMEGKNVCRLSDKMQMNHGNTVCLAGEINPPVLSPAAQRQKDYEAYKYGPCDPNNQIPPGGLSPCEAAKWKLKVVKKCQEMRQDWDDKWQPGRHAQEIDNMSRWIGKLEKVVERVCK